MKPLLLVSLLVAYSTLALSQSKIIETHPINPYLDLTDAARREYERITSDELFVKHFEVVLNQLETSSNNGDLIVDIQGIGCGQLKFQAHDIEYQTSDQFYYYGMLESGLITSECAHVDGEIILIASDMGKFGILRVNDRTFELRQLHQSFALLSEIDDSLSAEPVCGLDDSLITSNLDATIAQPRSNSVCDIKCLVLYTQNALSREGSYKNLRQRIELGIRQTNNSMRNSRIPKCDARLVLAGIEAINFTENNISRDLRLISERADVQQLRDEYEADIVLIMTNGDYRSTLGLAQIVGPDEEKAYAIIQTARATGDYLFSHEVGHLLGGRHIRDGDPGTAHAHNFKLGGLFKAKRGTIMAQYGSKVKKHVPHFSNPYVEHRGVPTGTDERNNAQEIRTNGCTISQFRISDDPAYVHIDGARFACQCKTTALAASLLGGEDGITYTYQWERTATGTIWEVFGNGGSVINVMAPCPSVLSPYQNYMGIRLTAYGSDGSVLTTYHSLIGVTETDEGVCEEVIKPKTIFVDVIPNPGVAQEQKIKLFVTEPGYFSIDLFSSSGRRVQQLLDSEFVAANRPYSYNIDIKNGVSGLLLLNVTNRTTGDTETRRFYRP